MNEMKWHRATKGLSRAQEIEFAAQLDQIWITLAEEEQEDVERELQAIDASGGADEHFRRS
jgi:hypothetical protein